jgi:signal transduction histidine kinase
MSFRTKVFLTALPVAGGGVVVACVIGASETAIWRLVGLGSLIAIAVAALLAWVVSALLARRVRHLAAAASRLAAGDLRGASEPLDSTEDELGRVARALDRSTHVLGRRLDELVRDRTRTDAILSSMIEGVLIVDRRGAVQMANDAARRMLRLGADVTGHHYLEAIRHPAITERIDAALAGQRPDGLPLTLATDRAERQVLVRAAPVAADGGDGAVLVLHDITDLRLADQIRRDFVANVSHELRTPLTSIRGYLEALNDDGLDATERQQFLAVISRQTLRMERMVRDLLRLARLDARQEPLTIQRCDAGHIVDAVALDLAPAARARRQAIAPQIADAAVDVLADPAKLHDVLRNLIENAIAYSPEGGTITVGTQRNGEWITLEVADRGPGIPDADLTRVFERFYRVDKSRGEDPGGTGLGLAIAKHLVGLLEGQIWASNRPGGGATFTVRLRAADEGAPAGSSVPKVTGPHSGPASGTERAGPRAQ